MSFKIVILISFLFVSGLFLSCGDKEVPQQQVIPAEIPATPPVADSSDVAVVPFDTSDAWLTDNVFPKNLQAANLSEQERSTIDSLLTAFFANNQASLKTFKARHKPEYSASVFDLKAYKKQYIAIFNGKGEKEVWINCFCKGIEKVIEFKDWKKTAVRVSDGGDCFFNVKLNLNSHTIYNLRVNAKG